MIDFSVTILGCGSAKPTLRHLPSSQVVSRGGFLFMVDCGEGAQLQFVKQQFHSRQLHHVFISHAHGDHCLGLVPMISSLSLEGRRADLHVYAPSELIEQLKTQIAFFVHEMSFELLFHRIDCQEPTRLCSANGLTVTAFPLDHVVPCYGFLFEDAVEELNIRKECIQQYSIPYEKIVEIKHGQDYVTEEGICIPNAELTLPPALPRRYAYCSDTRPVMALADLLSDVDLLYHEATYTCEFLELAIANGHSTAEEAARFAAECHAKRLLIGHYSSRYKDEESLLKEASEVFADTLLAHEGLRVEIGE